MRKLLLAIMLLTSAVSFSQDTIRKPVPQDTSASSAVTTYEDSVQKEDMKRMAERSTDYFANLSKERQAQQRKQAIMYIAIGVFFLAVLIIGLLRKRKKVQ